MKKYLLLGILSVFLLFHAWTQSDNCSSATVLTINTVCTPSSGSTLGMTQNIAGCSGNADDDVWYQFTATATSHQIVVTAGSNFDPVVQLFSGNCSTLVSLVCRDNGATGATETINATGLTSGTMYKIRVYHYGTGSGSGDYTICVTGAPTPPANDNCANAVTLPVNTTCSYTSATTDGATQSLAGCSGTADDDVWFKFTATNALQHITVHPVDNIDPVVQVYSGTCSSLSSLICEDNTFSAQDESFDLIGLVAGQTYYLRIYDYYSGNSGDFQICVTGAATAAPTNDEPCNALQLPAVTSACQYAEFTTVGATASTTAPTPASCSGGSGAQIGGFSSSTKDIWFKITVPASGNLQLSAEPNMGSGSITDGVMVLYSGTCSSLTQIACSDDYPAYPGTSNDYLPLLNASGLTPGSTVYLRYFGYNTSSGSFGICVTTATNDDCANALYICDLNGYSATTSAAYTADRPCNMHGNNETQAGVNLVDGTNSGGPFGYYPPSDSMGPYSSPALDVNIDNNSWIKFKAADTTATLQVSVYDCWIGNYPSGGIQMQIFSGTNCCNFVPVSDFKENSSGFTITAHGLTVGQDYYLMVDGYAGDVCSYTITAQSGVQFPDIPDVQPICYGGSVVLTAPAGASSYSWQHNGATTQSVTVTPSTTETYSCIVYGVCGDKQTLDVTVQVKPNPDVQISNGASVAICQGTNVTLNATGAATYAWNTGATTVNLTVSPTSATTYTVTGTTDGCTATDAISVVVHANPTLAVVPTITNSNCGSSTGSLTGATASGTSPFAYTWTNGGGTQLATTQNLMNIPAGVYYLAVTDGNGCSANFGPYTVSNPGAPAAPSVSVSDDTPCLESTVNFNATSSTSGATFNWTGPNGFTSSNSGFNLVQAGLSNSGNYCVTATAAGCTGPSTCVTLAVQAPPDLTISASGNDSTICLNAAFGLTASGAGSYSWNGPNGFASTASAFTVNQATLAHTGYYIVTGTDANGCSGSDSLLISILQLPIVNANIIGSSTDFCEFSTILLQVSGAQNYQWTGPNNFTSSQANPSVFNAGSVNSGYYYVAGTDQNGCSNGDSILIAVHNNPIVSANVSGGITSFCEFSTVQLEASGAISYDWSGPENFTSTQSNPQLNNATSLNSGTYQLVGIDAYGCIGSDSIELLIQAAPTINITADDSSFVFCYAAKIVLNAEGAVNYVWTGPNSFTASGSTILIDNAGPENQGWYIVNGADNLQCEGKDSIYLKVASDFANATTQGDSVVCPGGNAVLEASGGVSYVWNGPQNLVSYLQQLEINPVAISNTGWYTVIVTDENGCQDVDSAYLLVQYNHNCIKIPDLITPDDDNHNDTWTIEGIEAFPENEVEIYNRWGSLLYKVAPYSNDWYGQVNTGATIDGKDGKVPVGTYFYILKLNDGYSEPVKGYIEVQY